MTKKKKILIAFAVILCVCVAFGVYDHQKRHVTQELSSAIDSRSVEEVKDILTYAKKVILIN